MRAVADTNVYINDDPDNRILECAVEAGANVVITGDHDLRQLGAFRNIRILRACEEIPTRMTRMAQRHRTLGV